VQGREKDAVAYPVRRTPPNAVARDVSGDSDPLDAFDIFALQPVLRVDWRSRGRRE
jgi:hypothetical protein